MWWGTAGPPPPPVGLSGVPVTSTLKVGVGGGQSGKGAPKLPRAQTFLSSAPAHFPSIAELRDAVQKQLGYSCSAGIAHNKLLAKLCSGLNKPAKQTILPSGLPQLHLRDNPLSA